MRYLPTYLMCLILVVLHIQSASAQILQSPEGTWEGKMKLSGIEVRLIAYLKAKAGGGFEAKLASPDQGPGSIPVQSVMWKNDSLILDVKAIAGKFVGKYNVVTQQIEGNWSQNQFILPLNLKKTTQTDFAAKRPQEPKPPFPYLEEEIVIQNTEANIVLGGTLTIPQGKGPFKVVILISGSGVQNRNEEIMSHKPFLVLADHLTRNGIAVVRLDDRGIGKSTGNPKTTTSSDYAQDILYTVNYLKTRTNINAKQIGLIGHSEGGMVAPMVASQTKDVAFIVLLAGLGLTGADVHRKQMHDILAAAKTPEAEINKALALNEKIYSVIKNENSKSDITADIEKVVQQNAPELLNQYKKAITTLSSPWFRYFINFNPQPYLNKVKCPVLALNGSKDIQVDSKMNLASIEKHLKSGVNKSVIVQELPGLNHLFQTAQTGQISEYGTLEETFAPSALKIISDWVIKQ